MRLTIAFLAALAVLARATPEDKRQTTPGLPCIKQDITYMVDSSSGIGVENFLQQLEFIKANIRLYNINPACTRVSVVTYNAGTFNQFYLNQYTTQQQLLNAIGGIKYVPGNGVHTGDVINYVSGNSFSSTNGGRVGVPHYGVLVTGSASSNQLATETAAHAAQGKGMTLFTVGTGSRINRGELMSVAGSDKNQFYSQNYNSLGSLAPPLASRINGVSTVSAGQSGSGSGTSPASCLQQADVVFMVDGSGSIGAANFAKLENFIKDIVGKLDVGPSKVHVGLVQFSNRPQQEFPLNMYTSSRDVMTGVDRIHYMGGGTNTADALKYARTHTFSQSAGARPNVPRIGIVITDGRSSNSARTTAEANNARADNIGLLAIGVGNGVDMNELHHIADDPDSANTFKVDNYDQLNSIAAQIVQRSCQVQATAKPFVPTVAASHGPDTCVDLISNCANYEKSVCTGSYFGWAKDNCARYCGFCQPLYTTAPPPCVDRMSNCHEYEATSCVGSFKDWAKDNCRKFCGYCDATGQSVGFYGRCYYKGKSYRQGENWDDGCDYSCTCTNGATGQYQCFNKCPVYYNLPAQCTLVKSSTQCCLKPVCDFQPSITSFETTMHGKTPDGIDVCVYKNHQYYQGQTWEDGCQYSCTCTDAARGVHKCQSLCPTYSSVPSFCHMQKQPGQCCSKPVCEFKTQQGSFTGSGTISGQGTGIAPTSPPPCVDAIPDCDRYGQEACTNFKPWARDNCRKTCNLCVEQPPNPAPTDVCIYDGKAFHQGESWKIGCDTTCTCENAAYGYYRCVNSCPTYNNLPSTCHEVKKAGDCCTKVQCDAGTGTFISSTGNLATIGNGGLINVGPTGGAVPTLPSGGTPAPGTGGTIYVPPALKGCLYKGDRYIEGQIWDDGCQYACECTDGNTGIYTCRPKCPTFPSLPSECHLEMDPSDECCQRPKCQFTGAPIPVVPVYPPSQTGHNLVEPPKPSELYHGSVTVVVQFTQPGLHPTPPTANPNITGGIGHCEYKGKMYQQAEHWEDGCLFNCVCEDSSIGFYRCLDKCPKYQNLPPQCHLVQDPSNTCCQIPKCVFVGNTTSIMGHGVITTPKPIIVTQPPVVFTTPAPRMCVYKGNSYSQNQMWFDGCDKKCTCDDATAGYYRCNRRCPEFFNVPTGCKYVPDPNDPSCCSVPQCVPTPPPGQTLAPGMIPTIAPGTFVGGPNATGHIGFCEYKGQHYMQGQTWQDGCDYTCNCEDAAKGLYKCADRCPSFGALPPQCKMVADFTNPCCRKPDCDFSGNFGQITGTLTPAPRPGVSTLAPNIHPTPAPKINYCVYKTAQYSNGQTWNDGCQYKCRCDDASRGLYVCDDRCPSYGALPAQCRMVADPNDACCQQPKCDFTPTTGQVSGTLAPNMIPTKVPGTFTGRPHIPVPTPGPDGHTLAPQPLNFCVYKGTQYRQGARWDDGCDYTCRCEDAATGMYKCDEKCPQYTGLPPQCRLIKDAAQPCCFTPVCDFTPTSGGITGQGTTLAPIPGVSTVAPVPGHTNAPNPNPNPNPYPTPGLPKAVCVYKTNSYTQGQQWFDGCNFKCTCEDAMQGVYRCSERCAAFPSVPAGCTLVADPADPMCCKIPQCAPNKNSSVPFPTPPPGHVTGGTVTLAPNPMNTPAPQPGVSTQRPPINPTMAPTPKAVCIYKGKQYTQGQRWQDGCDYNCVCKDAMSGLYDCTEICAKFPNLPAQCYLVQDFNKPCCKVPHCDFTATTGQMTGQMTTPVPIPGVSTLAPTPGLHPHPSAGPTLAPTPKVYCKYNGVTFRQGQRWDDGCDLQCVCENEMTGYYRCNQRCGDYPSIPQGCVLETDPNDPCCRVPVCKNMPTPAPNATPAPQPHGPTPSLGPGQTPVINPTPSPNMTPAPQPNPTPYLPTLAPPVIIGQGVKTTPQPGVTTLSPPLPVCIYNGKSYSQGQTWQDGCQLNCECINAMTGQYRCVERCAVYPSIPSFCRMVTNPKDACCKVPECTQIPTPAPGITPAPTPGPGVSTIAPPRTPAPVPGVSTVAPTPGPRITPRPTPQPQPVCIMKGRQYTQGQRWNDGCDRVCVCDDGVTGHYTCTDRCKMYASIPKDCTMVPDPSDPICCQVPQCIPVPGTNGYPTPGPTDKPTMYTNAPHAVVTGTGTPPTPLPRTTVAPLPGVSTQAPTPKPKVCVYKGQTYLQDQRWKDGCAFDCICNDGITGRYTCTARCGTYPNLPRQCTLQRDPKDYCCYVPVCDWAKPTPNPYLTPGPIRTPAPQPGVSTVAPQPGVSTVAPQPVQTLAPKPKAFCVMNGVTFGQGQILNDGCSQRCRCDDADTNYYNCYERCATFPSVPAGCFMVTDPKDSCCQIPQCNVMPTPAPNPMNTPAPMPGVSTLAPNPLGPTLAPGINPTPGPFPTLAPSPIPTAVPGQIISKPDPTRPPQQRGFCVYNGIKYTKGQTWDDGCTYICECLDDMTGQYKCTERCPQYPSIPSYCVMVQDPKDRCCKTPYCPGLTPTLAPNQTPAPIPGVNPTPAPNPMNTPAPNPGSHPSPVPGVSTLAPNPHVTVAPNPMNTPSPNPTPQPHPLPKDVCVMGGKSYTQGQRWYDGCKQVCVCDDGVTGHYTCNQRCPTYTHNLQPTCVFVPDPNDPACCQVPQCINPNSTIPVPVIGTHTGGGPVPTPRPNITPAPIPGQSTLAPYPYPGYSTLVPQPGVSTIAPRPGYSTLAPHILPTPAPGPKVCVYKGSQYIQGQKWRDGCQYDCVCDDAMHGRYTCTDICPVYPGLPTICRMVHDPLNPCCQKPDCSALPTPKPNPTLAPVPGVSTLAPTPGPQPKIEFCVYKGLPLRQGQTYNDGCDKVCRCEDTMSNTVVCDERCPTYPPLRSGCTMVTDPNDACCQVPQCAPVNPPTNPGTTIITGVPGTITGHNQPNPVPGTGPSGTRDVCLYHGVQYKTGSSWDDGCTYRCICVDGNTGSYRCTERCSRYPKVPAQCSMVQDPADSCCQKPYCPFMAPTPSPNMTPAPQPGVSTPAPHINPTLAPQPGVSTPAPHINPTLAPIPGRSTVAPLPGHSVAPQPGTMAPTPAPRMVCQYKNQMYQQNQVWYDDCNAICRCEDAMTGFYRCQERCAKYTSIPSSCTMVPDPKDPTCCKVPSCMPTPAPGVKPTPGYLQPNPNTPAPPKVTGIAPVPTSPYPTPGPRPNTPVPQPGVSTIAPQPSHTLAPTPRKGCLYNGKIYAKGQRWDDGCTYHCICDDDMTGKYTCTKRCADYPVVPSQCVLVQSPKDACCKVPYCDYLNPTPFPGGIPTPAPNPFATPLPAGQTTLAPGMTPPPGYCVYKGVYYTQGQTWDDGCDKKCRCDDVSTGFYSCTNRCPAYNNLPKSCVMKTDPNDNCCLVPDCNTFTPAPTPGPGMTPNPLFTFNPGTFSPVTGSGPRTTPAPIIVVPTYIPGTFTGTSNNNPNGNYGTGPSGKSNACVYKTNVYQQGQTWDDGCQFQCTCMDALRGQYRCTERCPRYVNLPAYCTYKTDPRDSCCKVASCDLSLIPTPQPQTPTPRPPMQTTQVFHPGTNTGMSGSNQPINPSINPGISGSNKPAVTPTSFTGVRDKCVYKDMSQHNPGTTWQDGCDFNCVCEDTTTNSYRCTARCQVYSDLPSSCFLIQDPNDSCCKVPRCSGTLNPVTVTGTQPSGPSGSNPVPIGTHTSFTGSGRPSVIPGMSVTGSRSVCMYKGTVHQQGQSWDDGCDYTCTCTDGPKGLYKCTSKCPAYPSAIPTYCKFNKIPGMCCPSLTCNIPTAGTYHPAPQLVPTPAPSLLPGQTPAPNTGSQVIYPSGTQPVIGTGTKFTGHGTAVPPGTAISSIRNQCIYKNRLYNQGETWEDGCDYQCECMDSSTGFYQCKPLCPQYQLPSACFTVRAAGQCCEQPVCRKPDGTEFNPLTNPNPGYPAYGTYPAGISGFRPGFNPSTGTSTSQTITGSSNRCIYKGRIYGQGQKWDDGCDYTCQCTDAAHGMYSCQALCPTYTALPSACRLVTLPGQCCREPRCPLVTTIATPHINHTPAPHASGCYDVISNCKAYGQSACTGKYVQWAQQNCNLFCGFCQPTATTAPNLACVDVLPNCDQFGTSACTGKYQPWATDNCKKTCNLCSTTPAPFITQAPMTAMPSSCVDKQPNCKDFGTGACQDPYLEWAKDNCMKYCNLCNAVAGTPSTIGGSSGLPGNWMIMMKGVAGVPGNLYQLWTGSGTSNQNVPQAMYLTSQYPGHYKPDLSNYWNSLCIDKVKVAIFNNGIEKANIIFDASGADKNSWFSPSRIISSTWQDIKYAPKNIFSLLGDTSTGRQFFASSSGSGCNAHGWIMVSTQSNCAFEQGSNKPAFYYAPGQTSANFGTTQMASGDVFAILAHPNCMNQTRPTATISGTSDACIYKNKIYHQGDNWQDGCTYNCTCEDAKTGFYRCINLCPSWQNPPQGCTLQTPPGECCATLVCPTGHGNTTITNLDGTCYYGNKYYRQGETWRDGCKYNCECKDGKTGFYQCNNLCLQWNLPAACSMQPAPAGKCCQVPFCPPSSGITVQYPPGYVLP